jgi:acetyltransferase-like isoleucine patch superfamily enzyme
MNYNFITKLTRLTKLIIPNQIISVITRLFAFFFQNVKTHGGVIFDPRNKFEGKNIVLSNSRVYQSKVGRYTYISTNSLISKTSIGRYSSIGNWVSTGIGRHPIDFVSTHPLFHSFLVSTSLGFSPYDIGEKYKTHKTLESGYYVEIGSDVWIGDRVMIMDGITI